VSALTPLQQRRETVLDLYAKGRTPAEIATEVDATAKAVREIIGHARRSNDERTRNRIRPEAFVWTDEKIATVIRLKDTGLSAREIGEAIGGTKNIVIGKLHRLGMPLGKKPQTPPKPRVTVERKGPAKRPALKTAEKPVQRPRFVEAPVVASAPVLRLVSVGKPITSLFPHECRWPVSPDDAEMHLFCASRIATAGPYCDHCRTLAYAADSRPRVGYLKTSRFG
jgi:GcrA cell cycle regulator